MVVHTIADKDRICALDFAAVVNTEQDGLLGSGGDSRKEASGFGKKKNQYARTQFRVWP